MKFKLFAFIAVGFAAVISVSLRGAGPAGPVDFVAHDIDANFRGGYSVSVADFNKDGKPDVIANSLAVSELAWYERSEEHTSELQSLTNLVCRLLLEKKKKK